MADIWKDLDIINTTVPGDQEGVQIVQLSDGRILVTWESDDDTGAGSPVGIDIIGQLFDQGGNAIGGEFRVNTASQVDDETDYGIAATANGGFILSIVDTDDQNSDNASGRYEVYTADAAQPSGFSRDTFGNFATDTDTGATPNVLHTDVTVSGTTALFVYALEEADGSTSLQGRIYDIAASTLGTVFEIDNNLADFDDFEVDVLSDGNFVVGFGERFSATDEDPEFHIYDTAGALIAQESPTTASTLDSNVSITALSSGAFVMTWQTSTSGQQGGDNVFAVYNNAGTRLTSNTTYASQFQSQGAESVGRGEVVATNDGGFAIVYSEGDQSGSRLVAEFYDSNGAADASNPDIAFGGSNGFIGSYEATLLEDGRIQVTYDVSPGFGQSGTDDVYSTIIDPRDGTSDGVAAFIGTSGEDVLNETVGSNEDIFLGDGNDTLTISNDAVGELFDGGDGFDTLAFSGGSNSFVVDLGAGTYTESNGDTDSVQNFERVEGGVAGDVLTGGSSTGNLIFNELFGLESDRDNSTYLYGNGGDDVINTGGDSGIFEGGTGGDTLVGTNNFYSFLSYENSSAAVAVNLDTLTVAGGDATGDTITDFISVIGSDFNDVITLDTDSEGVAEGGGGADIFNGTNGQAHYASYILTATSGVRADLNNVVSGTNDAAGDVFNDILGILGSNEGDVLYGAEGRNSDLYGAGGDDTFFGNELTDMYGGDGYDAVNARAATSGFSINLGSRLVELVRGTNFDDILDASSVTRAQLGVGNQVVLIGNAGDDALTGSDFNDNLIAGFGNDTVNGGDGNDRIDAALGINTIDAGAGNDTVFWDGDDAIDGGAGTDSLITRSTTTDIVLDLATSGFEIVRANNGNDVLDGSGQTVDLSVFGFRGNDVITGGTGDDTLLGGLGNDTLVGGAGNDRLFGEGGADSLDGGDGDDVIFADDDDTSIIGGAGDDLVIIAGNSGIALNLTGSGIESVYGSQGGDDLSAFGSAVEIFVNGRGGNDTITGGFLDDFLIGAGGNDTLNGSQGNDRLSGGAGDDTFVFDASWGDDIVLGFDDGDDIIDLSSLDISFNDLTLTSVADFIVEVEYMGNTIEVRGVSIDDLDAADFIF